MTDEQPIAVEEFNFAGQKFTVRHFAPVYDTLTRDGCDTINFADGSWIGVHPWVQQPMYPASQANNRAGRRAVLSKKRGRR